ncbi:DUF4256 domain-containing protein [Mesonia sp. K7]|uniref:DUF4256 domain-containing protein n=1 Tax=Mesonia sp. K7 TaxID=2218606 RepID=UPI000DA8BF19|nr:DUF4256 domain-containing protein [Mesonia sp. K7]PZD77862.1 DUF4256 domain-containing protein [Mesonia sp. K7]
MSKKLTSAQQTEMLAILKTRFEENMSRHDNITWQKVEAKLQLAPEKLWSLFEMEKTGGEPDVVGYDEKTKEYIFFDCVKESPKERRSLCYDQEALESRKKFKPKDSALNYAQQRGLEILTEEQYHELQKLGKFDTKTSSWLATPEEVRKLGGAIFGDFRFGRTFIYHNGAESYYAARGFRACLKV